MDNVIDRLKTVTLGASPETKGPKLLRPITQSGRVDVSDLAELSPSDLRKELVGRVRALLPMLERNAPAVEDARRVGEENIEALRAAGIFKIMVPRRFGGLETDIRTKIEVAREVAKGCGSTAWVTSLMNVCSFFAGLASAEAQEDIWGANPDARIAGVFNASSTSRKVDGGYIVSGRWPWSSGCLHADWGMFGIPIVDADGTKVGESLAFMPMSEITIEETWFTAGMRGSGSNTSVAEEVFVPEHRLISIPGVLAGETPTPYKDEALYRASFVPVAALILAGPQLGLCSRALEYVLEMAPKRRIAYTFYTRQTDSPSFQLAMAKAATLVDTAHLFAYRAADLIDEAARDARQLTYLERARIRMDVGHTVTAARDAIDILMSSHGASAFADFNPLQRIWRDCETASRHAVVGPDIAAEVYGRALVGINEGITPIV
jgi:alkylation response protein AidB-like acyl-CoA dehydrogenase